MQSSAKKESARVDHAFKMNKIMVVDDDQTILKVIRSNLERHDFQVLTAMDPKNALDKMNG